jgi:monofunctional biosynthetic peptidoglycan transglycosylase
MLRNICFLFILMAVPIGALGGENDMTAPITIVSFQDDLGQWTVVNDGVMGGVSRSRITRTEQGTGLFTGRVSLEFNGGFASVRTKLPSQDLSAFEGVEIRVKGNGRTYQLRFRNDAQFDGAAYAADFPTTAGEWTTLRIPFADFQPTFRGRLLKDYPPLDQSALRQLTFMIADKKAGPFRLEIDWVRTYKSVD